MPTHMRPEHPDFWLLSQVVIDQDARADNHTAPFEDLVGNVIDIESVAYMASQRALRVVGTAGAPHDRVAVAAVWMSAFLVGAEFQAKKAIQTTDEEEPAP